MQEPIFPKHENDLTPELLTSVLSQDRPGLEVTDFKVVEAIRAMSGQASTADRVILDLTYQAGPESAGLPRRIILKTMLDVPHAPQVMYETEVRFYREIRPQVPFEAPIFFGALFDRESGHFGILLEDLRERGAAFNHALAGTGLEQVQQLIQHLAALHAKFWKSPVLDQAFGWMARPGGGGMEEIFKHLLPNIQKLLDDDPWRSEILAPLGRSVPDLHADMLKVAAGPLESAPHTLLHGDTHIGNTYTLSDGTLGWLDFQLSHRGCYARDLTYLITTGLPIELRRKHERDLIGYYFEELKRHNVETGIDAEGAWRLHRQAALWGLVIGWLTCPTANYGRAITEENIRRLTQIIVDLDCFQAVPDA